VSQGQREGVRGKAVGGCVCFLVVCVLSLSLSLWGGWGWDRGWLRG
jgi:hypothetical protein